MAGIRAEAVSKTYELPDGRERVALARVDLDIADGEFVCLLGPSGCGKTTLLNILSGLDKEYEGRVSFTGARGGERGRGLAYGTGPSGATSRAGAHASERMPVVSYMFQESRLLPWLTVRENLLFVLDDDGSGRGRKARVDDWLERVRLSGYGDYYPGQLSVGMQQRVAVARALIIGPEVLFMDEPFSSLDELTASQMREELLTLWSQQRQTVVFVTHNPLEAAFLADRIVVMTRGPGRIAAVLELEGALPRPRDRDDSRLWRISREAVGILRGEQVTG